MSDPSSNVTPSSANTASIFAPAEGPIPAPSGPAVVIPAPPSGDNSAPPALTTTPKTQKSGIAFKDLLLGIFYFIFTAYAIYYGWILGQQKGREYLLYIQSFGPWVRSFFVKPV
jgi:hypothetical protein